MNLSPNRHKYVYCSIHLHTMELMVYLVYNMEAKVQNTNYKQQLVLEKK